MAEKLELTDSQRASFKQIMADAKSERETIIEAHNGVAAIEQLLRGVKADKSGGASNQNLHKRSSTASAGRTYLMS